MQRHLASQVRERERQTGEARRAAEDRVRRESEAAVRDEVVAAVRRDVEGEVREAHKRAVEARVR